MSTDLETALRDMLHERAGDITALPPRLTHPGQLPHVDGAELLDLGAPHHSARSSRWLLAAAVAVIIAIAGTVLGIRHLADHDPRPAAPNTVTPTGAPTTTTSTSASPPPKPASYPNGLHPLACFTNLPPAWQRFLAGPSPEGGDSQPVALTSSGGVISIVSSGWRQKLILDSPGHTPRVLFTNSGADSNGERTGVLDVSSAANWVVFEYMYGYGQGGPGPVQIEAVDLNTGAIQVVRPTTQNDATIVPGIVLFHGVVYWAEIDAGQGLSTGRVVGFNLSSRRSRVLDSGNVTAPIVESGGLYWGKGSKIVTYRAGQLPPGYRVLPMKSSSGLASSAGVDAWLSPSENSIRMWHKGLAASVTVLSGKHVLQLNGLSGHFLFWSRSGSGSYVMDTRTGAAAPLPANEDRRLVRLPPSRTSGYQPVMRYATPSGLGPVITNSLPGLHC